MNFLVQPMPPSTDYLLHFPGFNEIWCDLTSYEVPNVKISELCCSCQKETWIFKWTFIYFIIHQFLYFFIP